MWEASWGILLVIAIMFGIGLLASPVREKPRARFRKELEQIAEPLEAANRIDLGINNAAANTPYLQVAIQQGDGSPTVKEAAKKKAKGK